MRVLLVEDDSAAASGIKAIMTGGGHQCDVVDMGESGLESATGREYDIIILDLMLPDMDGCEMLRRLRATNIATPVLVLSGQSQPDEKVRALHGGADDYLTKPYDRGELIARIEAVLRRAARSDDAIVQIGPMTLNMDKRVLDIGGKPVHLTVKEFGILEFLAQHKGTTLSKDAILNHLYSGIDVPELKIIDVFVCKLRRKLSQATGGQNYIGTVWGAGYALQDCSEESPLSEAA